MAAPGALEAQGVTVERAGRLALEHVSASLQAGAVVGVVGPNGAGKSTLLRALAGLLPLSAGHITLGGRPMAQLTRAEIARQIAYVAQSTSFQLPFSVFEVVHMGRFAVGDRGRPSGRRATDEAIERLELTALADRPVTTLSGGERQRVLLARAVASAASIWILDEPAAALDLRHAFDVLALARARADHGGLVVFAHHDLNAVRRSTDRAIMLDAGRVIVDGPSQAALSAERVAAVFGVKARVVDGGALVFEPAELPDGAASTASLGVRLPS